MSDLITLGHGSGGRLTSQLVGKIAKCFGNCDGQKNNYEDCTFVNDTLAVTTDGFTVSPRVFPGGDIGELCICGATNDLAVRGVEPQWITLGVIAEEGLSQSELLKYMTSAAKICGQLGVTLAAGDTKVVPRGALEGVFLNVTALGHRKTSLVLGMNHLLPGDKLLLTTSPGRHGTVIGALRYGLDPGGLKSDCGALWPMLSSLLDLSGLRCMRDCTRGGLGTVLCEWSEGRQLGMEISENTLQIDTSVQSICDILGFDPLYLASEGCALIACSPDCSEEIISRLKKFPMGSTAREIGTVTDTHHGVVGMKTNLGGMRVVDMPIGELLPRIC